MPVGEITSQFPFEHRSNRFYNTLMQLQRVDYMQCTHEQQAIHNAYPLNMLSPPKLLEDTAITRDMCTLLDCNNDSSTITYLKQVQRMWFNPQTHNNTQREYDPSTGMHCSSTAFTNS